VAIIHEITSPKDDADDELLVTDLHFSNNDAVKKNDELVDLETSKTTIAIETPASGYVEYLVKKGQTIPVGEVVCRIHDMPFDELALNLNEGSNQREIDNSKKIISKDAAKYIKENNVDISHIKKHFIGISDLVIKEDTTNFKPELIKKSPEVIKTKVKPKNTTEVKISHAKLNEIKALSGVQSAGLVSTIFVGVDVNKLEYDYETEIFKNSQSLLPIIIFEVSRLMQKFPILNAYFDEGVIQLYDNINLGIAFDIDDGLKVCTLRETNKMSMSEIEQDLSKNIDDYLNRALKTEQLTGSTFTITDLSSFGVDGIIPLVNLNQCAILGISSIDKKLNRINLSLAFDHRVTEGKVAGLFLSELKDRITSHTKSIKKKSSTVNSDLKCNYCMKSLDEDKTLKGSGLLRIINHSEEEQLICKTCLDGWK